MRMAHDGIVNGAHRQEGPAYFDDFALICFCFSFFLRSLDSIHAMYYIYISVHSFDEMKEKKEKEWNGTKNCHAPTTKIDSIACAYASMCWLCGYMQVACCHTVLFCCYESYA